MECVRKEITPKDSRDFCAWLYWEKKVKDVGISSLVTHKIGDISVLRITVMAKGPGDNDPPVQGAVCGCSRISPHSEDVKETQLKATQAWTCSRLNNGEAGRTNLSIQRSQCISSHAVSHMCSPRSFQRALWGTSSLYYICYPVAPLNSPPSHHCLVVISVRCLGFH